MSVLLETTIGDLVVDLYTSQAPQTSMNFIKLCKAKYYNNCVFHRVEAGFVASCGDPSMTGKGGSSVLHLIDHDKPRFIPCEISPKLKHKKKGTVSMLTMSDDSGYGSGSQFFITLVDDLDYLDENHTIFGIMAEGLEVLDRLAKVFVDDGKRPLQDIWIRHTVILDDPYEDPKGFRCPSRSPSPSRELLKQLRVGAEEEIAADALLSPEVLEARSRRLAASAQALTLEMIGDLPSASIAPPENVLFVCKLNPITTSEDLALIFSRFGTLGSCEVIKDQKTGDSLQYAFVEFEDKAACEEAYFKMDKVLVDDRRIHVDFSQSVSKLHKAWHNKRMVELGNAGKGIQIKDVPLDRRYDIVYEDREGPRHNVDRRHSALKSAGSPRHERRPSNHSGYSSRSPRRSRSRSRSPSHPRHRTYHRA